MINRLSSIRTLAAAAIIVPAAAFAPTFAIASETLHPDVNAALSWTLPENKCEQPKLSGAGIDVVDSTGATNRQDVDSYKLARYHRAEKRWKKCVAKYKKGLLKDFSELKASAKHGLTQDQANTILAKMAEIQSAIESPTGVAIGSKD